MKQAGLALPDPTLTDPENWTASCFITGHLVAALRGQVEFRTADHSACIREGHTAVQRRIEHQAEEALAATIAGAPFQIAHQLQWAIKTRAWLTVQLSTVNGTYLGAQEWHDALFLRYGLDPPDILKKCDGCNAKFTICHALDCKRGGLIMVRHNMIRERFADLAGKSLTPFHVRISPLIFAGCALKRLKAKPDGTRGSTDQYGAPPPYATE